VFNGHFAAGVVSLFVVGFQDSDLRFKSITIRSYLLALMVLHGTFTFHKGSLEYSNVLQRTVH